MVPILPSISHHCSNRISHCCHCCWWIPLLWVLSCPILITGQPQVVMNINGISAFTRTSDPLTASSFSSGDVKFTKSCFQHPIMKLCSSCVDISTALKHSLKTYLGTNTYAASKDLLPFWNNGPVPFQSPTTTLCTSMLTITHVPYINHWQGYSSSQG